MAKIKYKIGIDEVGRGPLAGPVTVAAFLMPANGKLKGENLPKLCDSKKMSEINRQKWSQYLKADPRYGFAVASFSAKKIDRLNVSRSANLCAQIALLKLEKKTGINNLEEKAKIYLDGGLYIGDKQSSIGRTIVKGDEKIKVISAASIIAKVYRDKLMNKYAIKFANYGFELNKGYGTKRHIGSLKKFGPTSIHRKTYIKNFL